MKKILFLCALTALISTAAVGQRFQDAGKKVAG